LSQELEELGLKQVKRDSGGVRFQANLQEALRVCLWTRIAMRVLYPLGTYPAHDADGLYEASREVAWEDHFTPDTTFAVEATLKNSAHTHSGFVAQKIKDGLVDRLREKQGRRPDVDTRHPRISVVAYLSGETLSLSLDVCGQPLFQRGYRVESTPAPLKETLAAALLRAARYTGDEPLFDPMCGSGTLLIEAGLIARRRAPAIGHNFAIEQWPAMETTAKALLSHMREEARAQERPAPFPIVGMDKDPDAVEAARRNVRAAYLNAEIQVLEGDALQPIPEQAPHTGLLITNPPYGERLKGGGQKGMKSFYFKLGENLHQWTGLRQAFLSGNPAFESAFHARPRARRALWNGPIDCTFLEYSAREPAPSQVSSAASPAHTPTPDSGE
jgi:putative N6-adenine-specific DNA methylase